MPSHLIKNCQKLKISLYYIFLFFDMAVYLRLKGNKEFLFNIKKII